MADIHYLDVGLKTDDVGRRARPIIQALGEIRDGKGFRVAGARVEFTDLKDRGVDAWKFEYVDFADRAAALKALAIDLDRIDEDWRDCLLIG